MGDLEKQGMDMMQDPQARAKIEEIAKSRGISLDAAKDHFLKRIQAQIIPAAQAKINSHKLPASALD